MKGPPLPRSLDGRVVVLTGFRSNEVRTQIEARGGRVASAVSGKTDVVVCAKNDLESAKATEGRERGIPVVTLDSFQAAYSMVGVSKKKKNPTHVQTDKTGCKPRASRCYFALDNGGRPFKVCHDARRFWVLKQSDPDADCDVDPEFVTTVALEIGSICKIVESENRAGIPCILLEYQLLLQAHLLSEAFWIPADISRCNCSAASTSAGYGTG